ncbi:DUF3455 domain-containing protein [Bradyrhizobium sp. AZCC 1678]
MPLIAISLAIAALSATQASAQVPAGLAVPDAIVVATLHAEGAQIYDCKPGADGKPVWQFREPIAALVQDGKTVGRHYAGPNWEHMDGSAIRGKAAATAPGATSNDIAWLKLDVTEHHGEGTFATVTTVQRLNTQGGMAQGPCEKAGSYRSVAYSADYVFLRKRS